MKGLQRLMQQLQMPDTFYNQIYALFYLNVNYIEYLYSNIEFQYIERMERMFFEIRI